MGKNKKNKKLQLKKPLSNILKSNDSSSIKNGKDMMSCCAEVNTENLENVDIEPSLLSHINNIRNIDERVLLWNREDFVDTKANERLRNGLNIDRVVQSMQESPFSKYLQDQLVDLSKISKASISGVAMVQSIQDCTNRVKNLFNVDDKIQVVPASVATNARKEILNCWTNSIDGDTSSTNVVSDNSVTVNTLSSNVINKYTEELPQPKVQSEHVQESMDNIKEPKRRKKLVTDKDCVWKKHNKDRSLNENDHEDCSYSNKMDNVSEEITANVHIQEIVPRSIEEEQEKVTKDDPVDKDVPKQSSDLALNNVIEDSELNKVEELPGRQREPNIENTIDSVVLRLSGDSMRCQRVDIVHDIMSQYYNKSPSEDDGHNQDPIPVNKRRRIVRPSQFNDFVVGDKKIKSILNRGKSSSLITYSRNSLSSDPKVSKAGRRSASIQADTRLLKLFSVESDVVPTLPIGNLSEDQRIVEKDRSSLSHDIIKGHRKLESLKDEHAITEKDCTGIIKTRDVDKKLSNAHIHDVKHPVLHGNQTIKDGTAMTANVGAKDNQKITDNKTSTIIKEADHQKVSEDNKSTKKQKLVEWETLVEKQKVVSSKKISDDSNIVKDNKVKRKRRIQNKELILEKLKREHKSKVTESKITDERIVARDCRTTDKSLMTQEDYASIVNGSNMDNATMTNESKVTNDGHDVSLSKIGDEIEPDRDPSSEIFDCIRTEEQTVQIPKLLLRKGRKKIRNADIDAEEVINKVVEGRRIKHVTADINVTPAITTFSNGPRVKHVSRMDITSLDPTRKKCVIKSQNRSTKISRHDNGVVDESRTESSLEESQISDQMTLVSCNGCGICDNCLRLIKAGEKSYGTNNSKANDNDEKHDDEKDDQRCTKEILSSMMVDKETSRHLVGKSAVPSIDVYRDSDNDSSGNEKEQFDDQVNGSTTDNDIVTVLGVGNLTTTMAHEGGYPVVTSRSAMPNKVLCYSCGSGGDQMIHCVACAEPFHFFCIEYQFRPKSKEMFVCRNCTECHECRGRGSDLKCIKCQRGYHPNCVSRYRPSKIADRSKWVCQQCAMCVHCGCKAEDEAAVVAGVEDEAEDRCYWSDDPWQCSQCRRAREDGHVCPECARTFLAQGMDSVRCTGCSRSVHRQCAGLTEDEHQVHGSMAAVPPYECRQCTALQLRTSMTKAFCRDQVTTMKTDFIDRAVTKEAALLSSVNQGPIEPRITRTRSSTGSVLSQVDGTASDDYEEEEEYDDDECQAPAMASDDNLGNSSQSVDDYEMIELLSLPDDDDDEVMMVDLDNEAHQDRARQMSPGMTVIDHEPVLAPMDCSEYLTLKHMIMACQARIIVKLSSTEPRQRIIKKYKYLVMFLQELCHSIFPWIDFMDCMSTVNNIVNQYSARLNLVLACITNIVRDGLTRETEVFSCAVTDIEERLSQSLIRGRQEFIIYHSEQHLSALINFLKTNKNDGTTYMSDEDMRRCALCNVGGDDGAEGRLLYGGIDVWVHIQCALWSDEVFETEDGAMTNVHLAIQRGKRHLCVSCTSPGATVTCAGLDPLTKDGQCHNRYHFKCALNLCTDPILTVSRSLYCTDKHCPPEMDHKRLDLSDLLILRRVYIPSIDCHDRHRRMSSNDIVVSIGSLRIDNLGILQPNLDTRETYLCPVGYRARRLFWSMTESDHLVMYLMTVKNGQMTTTTTTSGNIGDQYCNRGEMYRLLSSDDIVDIRQIENYIHPTVSQNDTIDIKKLHSSAKNLKRPKRLRSSDNLKATTLYRHAKRIRISDRTNDYLKTNVSQSPEILCDIDDIKPSHVQRNITLIRSNRRFPTESVTRRSSDCHISTTVDSPIIINEDMTSTYPSSIVAGRTDVITKDVHDQVTTDTDPSTMLSARPPLADHTNISTIANNYLSKIPAIRPHSLRHAPKIMKHRKKTSSILPTLRSPLDVHNSPRVPSMISTSGSMTPHELQALRLPYIGTQCPATTTIHPYSLPRVQTMSSSGLMAPRLLQTLRLPSTGPPSPISTVVHPFSKPKVAVLSPNNVMSIKILKTQRPPVNASCAMSQSSEMSPRNDNSCTILRTALTSAPHHSLSQRSENKYILFPSHVPASAIPDYIVQLDGEADDGRMNEEKYKEDSPKYSKQKSDHLIYEIEGITVDTSPTDAWTYLTRKISQMRSHRGLMEYPFKADDGWSKFGLDHRSVIYLIEQMMGASHCSKYKFKYHNVAIQELREQLTEEARAVQCDVSRLIPRTVSERGCSRKDSLSFLLSATNIAPMNDYANKVQCTKEVEGAVDVDNDEYVRRLTTQFLALDSGSRARQTSVMVCRSSIDGRGLFARREFSAHDIIIEYLGETVRPSVSDRRQRQYERNGLQCYLFCLDSATIVDATHKGNAARFINHSCQPNCYSRIVTMRAKKHILIMALRRIVKGEELTYDYRFLAEDDKLSCKCASAECRRYLN